MDHLQGSPSEGPAPRTPAAPRNTTVFAYLDVLHRRWWIIVLVAAIAGGIGWWVEGNRKPVVRYTASVLIQEEAESSPLEGLASGAIPTRKADMSAHIELLRSRAVLGGVVRSLGMLRMEVVSNGVALAPTTAFEQPALEANAPAASYLIRSGPNGETLSRGESKSVISRSAKGGLLAGPGFRVKVRGEAVEPREMHLSVLDHDRTVQRLRDEITITQVPGTSLIRASYTSPDPQVAAEVLNVLALEYQKHATLTARSAASRRRQLVEAQLSQLADSVAASQAVLAQYQQSSGTMDPQLQGQTLTASLTDAEREARDLRFQEGSLEGLLQSLRSGSGEGALRQIAVSRDILPAGADLYDRLQQLQTERSRLTASRYGYKEGGPGVDVVDSLIAATKAEIRSTTEQTLNLVRARRQAAEGRVGDLRQQMGAIPGRTTSLDQLRRRLDELQKVYGVMSERYREAQIAEEGEVGKARVLDPATPPTLPDPAPQGKLFVLSLLIGLFMGTGGVFALEYFDTSIRRPEDAKRLTGLDVIGMVPELGKGGTSGERRLIVAEGERGAATEAFHMLRTTLHFARAERPRIIGVTSANPAEGKSVTAANFALAVAQHGARVLLIDGDLHRPTQHEAFGVSRQPGLSDVLVGDISPSQAVRPHAIRGMFVLPAGSKVNAPGNLLESDAFVKFLGEASEKFDTVVLDLPPVLAVADAAVMAAACDGVLVVSRYGETNRFTLTRAVDRLNQVNASLLGLVMNHVPMGRSGRYSGGYYGYHGYYYNYSSYYGQDEKPKRKIGRQIKDRVLSRK